jgi:nicotinamidase-related amidase
MTETERTALLVMDVQPAIVERVDDPGLLDRLARAITAARTAGIRVIYVRVGFRAGYPEVSPRNLSFAAIRGSGRLVDGDAAGDIDPAVAPQPGDVVVTKRRVSAFAGSDLEVILRAGRTEQLVLSGIATSGVVLSTLRAAADMDFGLTVLSDGCADGDAEVHRVLLEKVFPRQADVVGVGEWVERISARPRRGCEGEAARGRR